MTVTFNSAEIAGATAKDQAEATSQHHPDEVEVIVLVHDDDRTIPQEFKLSKHATLLDMMKEAVPLDGLALLPPGERPFDRLYLGKDTVAGPIEDLEKTVAEVTP